MRAPEVSSSVSAATTAAVRVAAEGLAQVAAELGQDVHDQGSAQRGDRDHADAEHEEEVEQLALDEGPPQVVLPDDPEGDPDRTHHPARCPEKDGEGDETGDRRRDAGARERLSHADVEGLPGDDGCEPAGDRVSLLVGEQGVRDCGDERDEWHEREQHAIGDRRCELRGRVARVAAHGADDRVSQGPPVDPRGKTVSHGCAPVTDVV